MNNVIDCGKLTVALSAYYAYRRGLPWMVNHVRSIDGADLSTASSTIPVGAMNSFNYADAYAFFSDAVMRTVHRQFPRRTLLRLKRCSPTPFPSPSTADT